MSIHKPLTVGVRERLTIATMDAICNGHGSLTVPVGDMQDVLNSLSALLTQPTDAELREAVEHIGEVLDNVRCHLGICGPGDDGERKADASDNWGILDALDECRTLLRAVQSPRLTPPADAEVREAVRYFDDLRGEWSDEQLEVHLETLLDYARAETPRLTREQKESALHLLSEMDKMLGEDMQPDDERPAALAMQRFCAAFPELGE